MGAEPSGYYQHWWRFFFINSNSRSSSVWSLAFSFSIFLSSRSSSVLSFFSVPVLSSFLSSVVSWISEYSS